jgi:hypothetical protein
MLVSQRKEIAHAGKTKSTPRITLIAWISDSIREIRGIVCALPPRVPFLCALCASVVEFVFLLVRTMSRLYSGIRLSLAGLCPASAENGH